MVAPVRESAVAATYLNEALAEIGRAALEANGIPALVRTGDAAGLLRAITGVQLIVRREDLTRARRILSTPAREPSDREVFGVPDELDELDEPDPSRDDD